MEVASPLTLAHAAAGTKRSLVCSPGLMDSTNRSPFPSGMDMTEDSSMQRAFKRRRFQPDTTMDSSEPAAEFPPFMNMSLSKNIFGNNVASMKRSRHDGASQHQPENLEGVVEAQASEIHSLKNAKASLEASLEGLKGEHEKTANENRILKRAVTIQQERQTHASNELQAARQFKVDAEQNTRRLEQMIISLRYHLQAQQSHPGNDFMNMPPPHVS